MLPNKNERRPVSECLPCAGQPYGVARGMRSSGEPGGSAPIGSGGGAGGDWPASGAESAGGTIGNRSNAPGPSRSPTDSTPDLGGFAIALTGGS